MLNVRPEQLIPGARDLRIDFTAKFGPLLWQHMVFDEVGIFIRIPPVDQTDAIVKALLVE